MICGEIEYGFEEFNIDKEKRINDLKDYLDLKYPQSYINVSTMKDNVYLISFPLEIHAGVLITMFEIKIDF